MSASILLSFLNSKIPLISYWCTERKKTLAIPNRAGYFFRFNLTLFSWNSYPKGKTIQMIIQYNTFFFSQLLFYSICVAYAMLLGFCKLLYYFHSASISQIYITKILCILSIFIARRGYWTFWLDWVWVAGIWIVSTQYKPIFFRKFHSPPFHF